MKTTLTNTSRNFRQNRLKVPKLGEVKIYMHRPLVGDPKEVTLVKKARGWYAHISCEIPDTPKVEPTDAVAVDVGTTHYLTTSEGGKEDNPRWYRKAEGLLHKHNQTMARRKKGNSNRWQKSVHAVASWGTFFEWCASIAERDGLHFHQVDPKHTSQTCSACGKKAPRKLSLSVRTFNCQFCGNSIDRDHNAALNILLRAACAHRGERWVTNLYETRNLSVDR